MTISKLKYIGAYFSPFLAILSFNLKGYWAFFGVATLYILVPIMEQFLPKDTYNLSKSEKELAKEILFGLEDQEIQSTGNNSLITEIIKETEADSISNDIRSTIDQNFAGIKSSIEDESNFKNEAELNDAIEETKQLNNNEVNSEKKDKKKKRFFFF